MGLVEELGELALATRLRRLADRLHGDVSRLYDEHEVAIRARWFPVLVALSHGEPLSISELGRELGLTHTAINQIAAEMGRRRLLLSGRHPRDRRQRLLRLSAEGIRSVERLQPLWLEIRAATRELAEEAGYDVLAVIAALEQRLDERSIAERVGVRLAAPAVTIGELAPEHAASFAALNREWLEELFAVEEEDRRLLGDPHGTIVKRGGAVLVARCGTEVIGTAAVIRRSRTVFELAKMTVARDHRGCGVGRRLAEAALARAATLGARRVVLLTSRALAVANELYRSLGFAETTRLPAGVPRYARDSYAMELLLDRQPQTRREP